jgi:transmembrane sensor
VKNKSPLNRQIYEEASQWLVHLRAGDADEDLPARQELDEWLRRSPEHVRAYLELSTLWEETASLDAGRVIDAEMHIARALADQNVVAITLADAAEQWPPPNGNSDTAVQPARHPRLALWHLLAASFVGLATMLALLAWLHLRAPVYETPLGEQRSITLDDGSSVQLNALSAIRVGYSSEQRSVELVRGQALFEVAKDAGRPFIVASGTTRVRAVGTQFDVNRKGASTVVTVIEGRVAVLDGALGYAGTPVPRQSRTRSPAPEWTHSPTSGSIREPALGSASNATSKAPPEINLSAGEQVTITLVAAEASPKRVNIDAATAWTQRQLVFDSAPLSEVAEEFNRYSKRPLVIRSPELRSFGIVGVFSSNDLPVFVRFLRSQPEILVTETDSEILIASRK